MSSPKWHRYRTPDGEFYSATAQVKKVYHIAGDGFRQPTPRECLDALEKHSGIEEAYLDTSGLIYTYAPDNGFSVVETLPSGAYVYEPQNMAADLPERLIPTELRADRTVRLEDMYDRVSDDIATFLKNEDVYRRIGTQYRRGILLYGEPGNGKTSFIRSLVRDALPKDAVAIFFETLPSSQMIRAFASSLGDRLKVFIFEELANVTEGIKMERLLDFLDGEKSVDKSILIATTNYPERLPGNLVDRPSRFDKLYKMGNPKSQERRALMAHYLMREPLDAEVRATKGISTAAIKECCILHHLRGLPIEVATKALREHSELVKKEFAENRSVGIGVGAYSDDD